jgi:endonuclease/exonuclease/phosphatase family metal-dependent hydrolase
MHVVTWNLYHGRAAPPAGRDLQAEFTAALAGWAWDVALLQEVPPWWPAPLARACGASMRMALTSRNGLLPLRRAIAVRAPDLIKSNGGGCNAILVRGRAVVAHRRRTLRRWPERRVVHAVTLAGGLVVANLHAQTQPRERPDADLARAGAFLGGSGPAILGGDLNVGDPAVPPGFAHAGGRGVDHVLARGLRGTRTERLHAGPLSDHPPVRVELDHA